MFVVSYFLGHALAFVVGDQYAFVNIFFIIGSLICYIVLFVIYFSFTNVGPPWYVVLALIQPVSGILIYSFFSQQITIIFFLKAIIFFSVSATIFAFIYGPLMAFVSLPYRKSTGIGGYNFIRAFIEALITDNHDDLIEQYFEKIGEEDSLRIQYLALRDKDTKEIKGLFLVPNVHFGPFKTTGSAALAEEIYHHFSEIPGLTIFHTTVTHAQNFTSHKSNERVIQQIHKDLANLQFENPEMARFLRVSGDKAKLLGTVINHVPILLYTMHPLPTDDIVPEIGTKITSMVTNEGFADPLVIDCHNSLIGDEITIKEDTEEANEMYSITQEFLNQLKEKNEFWSENVNYAVAHDPMREIPIASGIGAGGIIVHLFKVGDQETALIHVDANNAITPVRSAIVNLGENLGLDRSEFSTFRYSCCG